MCNHKEDPHPHPYAVGYAPPFPDPPGDGVNVYQMGYQARLNGLAWRDNPWIDGPFHGPRDEWTRGYVTAQMSYTDEYLRVIHL